jgi:hypothetical protein
MLLAELNPAELIPDREEPAVVAVGVTKEFAGSAIGGRGNNEREW